MAKSRSRMINDSFWDDPDLVDYTVETRTTLLLFLTCRDSNIIGVYRVNWRTVGAGLGWTREQSINSARLVVELGGIAIDEDTGWVWVKEWWKHNSLSGAFTGNVSKRARQEFEQVPYFWKSQVLDWINANDTEGACKGLISLLAGAGGNPNPIFISNSTPTTPTLEESALQRAVVGVAEMNIDELLDAAQWAKEKSGAKINSPTSWRASVRARLEREGPKPEDLMAMKEWHMQREREVAIEASRKAHDPVALIRTSPKDAEAQATGAAMFEKLRKSRNQSAAST